MAVRAIVISFTIAACLRGVGEYDPIEGSTDAIGLALCPLATGLSSHSYKIKKESMEL